MKNWDNLPIEPSEWPEGEGDPEPDSVECPECCGGGIVAMLLPSGHAELTCRRCEGEGMVENV